MKLAYVALALSLFPASLAFVPASSRSPLRTESSLNGWFQDLFKDRSETKEKEKEVISERFGNDIKGGNVGEFLPPTPEEEAANNRFKSEEDFKYMPSKPQTGVDVHICRLAATLSLQVYDLFNKKIPKLALSTKDHEVEVLLQEEQGTLRATNPTFGAVVCGDTMLLGWRGTQTLTDGISDFAFSPTSSVAWRKHAKNIKLQGAMTSLTANDIAVHEDFLIAECKKRGIKEIVTTGHSLGGGMGQVAHTILRAQIQDKNSPWHALEDVNVRSMVFCAPMTTVIVEEGITKETEAFVDEIDANSCNVVFSNDPIPRAYGYLSFYNDMADDITSNIGAYLMDGKRMPSFFIKRKLDQIATLQQEKVMNNDAFKDIVSVLCNYVTPGKICFYKSADAKPVTLRDLGAFDENGGKKGTFRSVKYIPYTKKGEYPITELLECHGAPRAGIAYDYPFLH